MMIAIGHATVVPLQRLHICKGLVKANILAGMVDAEGIFTISCSKRISSVSYTPLRAHETVLELVCRLLLENKNIRAL